MKGRKKTRLIGAVLLCSLALAPTGLDNVAYILAQEDVALIPAESLPVALAGIEEDGEGYRVYLKVTGSLTPGLQFQVMPGFNTVQGDPFPAFGYLETTAVEAEGQQIGTLDAKGFVTLNQAASGVSEGSTISLRYKGVRNSATLGGAEEFNVPLRIYLNGVEQPMGTLPSFKGKTANTDVFGGTYGVLREIQDGYVVDLYTNPTQGLAVNVLNMQITLPEGMTFRNEENSGIKETGVLSEVTGYESADKSGVYFVKEAVFGNVLEVSQFQPNGRRLDVVITPKRQIEGPQHVERVYVGTAFVEDLSLLNASVLPHPISLVSGAGTVSLTQLYREDQVPKLPSLYFNETESESGQVADSSEDEEIEGWEDVQDENANTRVELTPEELEGAIEIPYAIEEKLALDLPAGSRETIRQGKLGYSRDGEVIQPPVDQIDKVGAARQITPYVTERRANPALTPGDELVIQSGQYGLRADNERLGLEEILKQDELIEFSPVGPDGVTYIAYETRREPNASMLEGQERVKQKGEYGEQRDGVVTLEPLNEIIEYGTKAVTPEVVIPYGVTRRPNPDLPSGFEEVVQEGVNGIRKGSAVVREPVSQVIEFGPTNSQVKETMPVSYRLIYEPVDPTDSESIGKSKVEQVGELGEVHYSGNVLKEPVDEVIVYQHSNVFPKTFIPFKTIYEPDKSLKPGEQQVKQVGVFGRRNSAGTMTGEPVDEVICYGPNEDGTVPNLNQLANPLDPKSPHYRVRESQKKATSVVSDHNGMLMPELPGGTLTPDILAASVYQVYLNQNQGKSNRGLIFAVVGVLTLGVLGVGGFMWYRGRNAEEEE